jgi:hypothetical protein
MLKIITVSSIDSIGGGAGGDGSSSSSGGGGGSGEGHHTEIKLLCSQ